jgi:N-acetylglucosaminyl-diphospho-decaprenol L-rhamnosyltransferase
MGGRPRFGRAGADGVTPSVHIVLVNWNTGDHLRACLDSIAGSRDAEISRVTVVDNASADGSADGLEAGALPLSVVRNTQNVGFAAACNQGAAGSSADYLLFLNPDTRLFEDTLATVIRFMESDAAVGIGICGVDVLRPDGRQAIACSRFPSLRIFAGKATGLDRLLPRLFPRHHLTPQETRESRPVDQVIGAFYLVRRALFEQLGGFDTRYFMYFEEVDFALRARAAGAGSYFLKEAAVLHAENVSSDQIPSLRIFYSLRSRLLFARRHWRRRDTAALVAMTVTVEWAARLLAGALHGSKQEVAATLAGYSRFLAHVLETRRAVLRAR